MITKEDILLALREVKHPAKKDADLGELGMVNNIEMEDGKVTVTLAFPKRRDPLSEYLIGSARAALVRHLPDSVKSEVKTIVVDEVTPKARKSGIDELGLEQLRNVRHIIGIASGKGGVGKSTVSANLAIALARLGYKVGLLDTDIFGPSLPKMFGVEDARPYGVKKDGRDLIEPIEKYGVKMLSIGFFVNPDTATLWRGGMATAALKQLIADADWGDLDYFVLDTPPGTSDIHLTLLQTLAITGAVIVSTPQKVALADARKGIDMYTNDKVNVPILGLVENMAWFTPKELPENKYYIFGKDGCKDLAKEMGVPLLAQIPLVQGICDSGDAGKPAATDADSMTGQAFINLAQAVVTRVNLRNKQLPKTKIIKVKNS